MSVQIIITGDHATDALAQLKNISEALNQPSPEFKVGETGSNEVERKVYESKPQEINDSESFSSKKLSRGEHKAEADKMIAAGEKNEEIFPLLSKSQQKRVEEALVETVVEEEVVEEEVVEVIPEDIPETKSDDDNLFGDEEHETIGGTLTLKDLKDLISEKCKDENGNDDPKKYALIRSTVASVVPAGKEPKLSEVSEDKYDELYQKIKLI